jgi:hypothetical protein
VKSDPNFDRGCKIIVNQRIIAHALDYRLRPRLQVYRLLQYRETLSQKCMRELWVNSIFLCHLKKFLQKACRLDLQKYCAKVLITSDGRDLSQDFLEGRATKCLQTKFAEGADLLSQSCRSKRNRSSTLKYQEACLAVHFRGG